MTCTEKVRGRNKAGIVKSKMLAELAYQRLARGLWPFGEGIVDHRQSSTDFVKMPLRIPPAKVILQFPSMTCRLA